MSDLDWNMFLSSSSDVSEFTDVVTSFIAMLADTIVPTVKVRSFPNQKPWVDGSIHYALNARIAAYNSGLVFSHMDEYKAASYGLRRVVKDVKRRYRDKVESQMEQHDIQTPMAGATDYHRLPGQNPLNSDASLRSELILCSVRG